MRWRDTLTSGAPDAAKRTAALYSKDGVLWGTVSEEVRDTPEEIYDYFVSLLPREPRCSGVIREMPHPPTPPPHPAPHPLSSTTYPQSSPAFAVSTRVSSTWSLVPIRSCFAWVRCAQCLTQRSWETRKSPDETDNVPRVASLLAHRVWELFLCSGLKTAARVVVHGSHRLPVFEDEIPCNASILFYHKIYDVLPTLRTVGKTIPQDYFARLPDLRLTEYTPVALRVYGDFATEAGTYTFAWQGNGGERKEKRARFSFTMRRDPQSPTAWTIVEHHSSAMPTSPAELKHVKGVEF